MAWIKQFLLLWSIIHESLASKDTCSKPNFNIENVDMSDIMETQFEVGRKLRLKCQRGYKRKAGKSNLIKCQNGSEFAKWSDPILQCIYISRTVPAGKSLGLVIGASTSSCFVILLVILIFIWPLVCKNRTWCTRPGVAEHELTPMALTEVQTVENLSECGLLQQEAES